MGEHAKFSPSASKKWIMCPGSWRAEQQYPDTSSDAADEGTAAHLLLEWCLLNGKPAKSYPDKVITVDGKDWPVTGEMVGAVQQVVDHVRAYPNVEAEQRLDMSDYGLEDCWGTGDVSAFDEKTGTLYVDDLKYGRNVLVYAEHNPQLCLYGLGKLAEIEMLYGDDAVTTVKLTIHQPRRKEPDTWETTPGQLKAFAKMAREAQQQALSDDPPFHPGSHCKESFCKHRPNCDAYIGEVFDAVDEGVPEISAPPVPEDLEKLSELRAKTAIVRDWAKQVEDRVEELLNQGVQVPGWKLVEGKAQRKWADEDKAMKRLKSARFKIDQIAPRRMLTAPQAETLVGKADFKKKFADLVEWSSGKLTVVEETDPRPAAKKSAEEAFAHVDTESTGDDLLS